VAVVAAAGLVAWPGAANAVGPVGTLVVDCTGIEGWAQEPDMPDALIDVHLYFNGPAGDPAASAVVVTASQVIDAGCMGVECMHGYRSALPLSLLDGVEHEVHAYGIDLTGDPNLELGVAGVLSCPPPPVVGGELRHVVSPEVLGAWQFSVFFDRLVVADETLAGLVQGPVVDVGPQLRVDQFGGVWVLDQGYRRSVPPEVAPAWRLDPTTAMPLLPEEVALPEGTSLRPRPVLLQGTLPEVYLLDDHQCVVGDPDPACAPEPEDDTGGDETGVGSTGGEVGTSDGGSEESGEGSSGGTGGVVTGAAPAEDEEAEGCGCRGSGRGGAWGLVSLVLGGMVRRRSSSARAHGRGSGHVGVRAVRSRCHGSNAKPSRMAAHACGWSRVRWRST
jgi:hypothetical protein